MSVSNFTKKLWLLLKISSTENKCQLRKWFFNFLKVFSSFFLFFFLKFFSIGRAYLFVFFFWEIFLFSIMYDVANTFFFSVLWVFMGVFGNFFEIFMCDFWGFFLYVRSSSSRSNNLWWDFQVKLWEFWEFFLKIDRNGEEKFLWIFF